MLSMAVTAVLVVVLLLPAAAMTYEEFVLSMVESKEYMLSTMSKWTEKTGMVPGSEILLKNDLGAEQRIETDFAGDITLKPNEVFQHQFDQKGEYRLKIADNPNSLTLRISPPEWDTGDPAKNDQIAAKMAEKQKLEREITELEEKRTANSRTTDQVSKQAADAGRWTPELEQTASELADRENEYFAEIQKKREQITFINREIASLKGIDETVRSNERTLDQRTKNTQQVIQKSLEVDFEQVKESLDTAKWVRTLFTWNEDGMITDMELAVVLKYLIENEIIK